MSANRLQQSLQGIPEMTAVSPDEVAQGCKKPPPFEPEVYQQTPGRIMQKTNRLLVIHSTGAGKTCTLIDILNNHFQMVGKKLKIRPGARITGITIWFPNQDIVQNAAKAIVNDCKGILYDYVQANITEANAYKGTTNFPPGKVGWLMHNLFFRRATKEGEIQSGWGKRGNLIEDNPLTTVKRRFSGNIAGELRWFGKGRLIICDEVHEILKLDKDVFDNLMEVTKRKGTRIVGLTATPMVDGPTDFARLVNFINGGEVLKVSDFGADGKYVQDVVLDKDISALFGKINGLFAYYDVVNDTNKFPLNNALALDQRESDAKPYIITTRMPISWWYGMSDKEGQKLDKRRKEMEFIQNRVMPALELTDGDRQLLKQWQLPASRVILQDIVTVMEHGDEGPYNVRLDAIKRMINRPVPDALREEFRALFKKDLGATSADVSKHMGAVEIKGTARSFKKRWDNRADKETMRLALKMLSYKRKDIFNGTEAYLSWKNPEEELRLKCPKLHRLLYDERIGLVSWTPSRGKILVYSHNSLAAKDAVLYIRKHLSDRFHDVIQQPGHDIGGKIPFCYADDVINAVGKKVKMLSMFNNGQGNCCGSDLAIMFIKTPRLSTGVDFKAVREIHLLKGILERGSYMQMIGRGIRLCSHKCYTSSQTCGASGDKTRWWNTTIYKHFSRSPSGEPVFDDEADLRSIAQSKMQKRFMAFIAASAVDCQKTHKRTKMPCGLNMLKQHLANNTV